MSINYRVKFKVIVIKNGDKGIFAIFCYDEVEMKTFGNNMGLFYYLILVGISILSKI